MSATALQVLSPSGQGAWQESFLANLPTRAQDALLDTAFETEFPSGHTIYRELYRPTGAMLGLVVDGLVRVFVSSPLGREITTRHAHRGDVVGLPAVVADGAPSGAQAVTGCRLVRLQVRTLRRLAETDAAVSWAICQQLTAVVFEATQILADNVFKTIGERVARALLDVARDEGGVMVVRTGQQELADEIGSVREVVARALRQLRTAGLIERRKDRLVITDPEALRRIG